MKNFFMKVALPMTLSFFMTQSILAAQLTNPFSKKENINEYITHRTNIDVAKYIIVDVAVYLGEKKEGACQKGPMIRFCAHEPLIPGQWLFTLSRAVFDGYKVDDNSCVLEDFYVEETRKITTVEYMLTHDAYPGPIGNPFESNIKL